ncbi:MAG: hypothetical protein L0Z62_28730 [Gemmataceae bacterium]|nr:hypothetical protein [Gemmataceae bacterium]
MTESEPALPVLVSRFEANLLEILRFFMGRLSVERAQRHLLESCERPKCLSRAAVNLVQGTLTKGCTRLLAESGAWRRERHLRRGKVVEGRLWERTDPEDLGLTFSPCTLEFLIRVTAEKLEDKPDKVRWWAPPTKGMTLGDELFLYYAFGALRTTAIAHKVAEKALFTSHPLCRLAYPQDFDRAPANVKLEFGPWTEGVGGCILEALQLDLAERWVEAERLKADITSWQVMQARGQSQGRVLEALLDTLETTGRRDLARFLLIALSELLPENAAPERWLAGMRQRGNTIAERTQTGRDALIVLRQLQRLRRWALEARGVAFFEETYAASQLWKTDWERWHGDVLWPRADAILREVEPL